MIVLLLQPGIIMNPRMLVYVIMSMRSKDRKSKDPEAPAAGREPLKSSIADVQFHYEEVLGC